MKPVSVNVVGGQQRSMELCLTASRKWPRAVAEPFGGCPARRLATRLESGVRRRRPPQFGPPAYSAATVANAAARGICERQIDPTFQSYPA